MNINFGSKESILHSIIITFCFAPVYFYISEVLFVLPFIVIVLFFLFKRVGKIMYCNGEMFFRKTPLSKRNKVRKFSVNNNLVKVNDEDVYFVDKEMLSKLNNIDCKIKLNSPS